MNNQKVAIVGAGICGLYLAWKLAKKGNTVTVFEKKERVGKETCSGLFSERILKFIPESKDLIQNQIEYCLIHFPKRTIKVNFSNPEGEPSVPYGAGKFFVMSHFELDNLVASLAEKAGAKIILNHSVSSGAPLLAGRAAGGWRPEGFDKIIGCDGSNSVIRKNLRLPEPDYRLAIQGFISKKDYSNFIATWPTKSGFLWKIPRGEKIEYGIIEKPERAKKLFDKFLRVGNLALEGKKSALVPQGLIVPQNPSITLCGDAVGLTKPWSGGGVIWGLTAAEILLKNFPNFLKYQKELKKFFLPKFIFSKVIKKIIYFLGFKLPWILPKQFKIEGDFLS